MKRLRIHTIEMMPEGKWLLSIGTKAPWQNRIQFRFPRWLAMFAARLER